MLTQDMVEIWLKVAPDEFHYKEILDEKRIEDTDKNSMHLRKIIERCVEKKLIKPKSGQRGIYRKIKPLDPVKWWEADETEYFNLAFPQSHDDMSSFGFVDNVRISPGDMIVLAGASNAGKSTLALNFLAENCWTHPCVVMGNEYTMLNNEPSPRFKRRMLNMTWAGLLVNGSNPPFDILPVRQDFEDYIQPDKINIIDWINLPGDWYKIGKLLEDIKANVGKGIAIVVLQKKHSAELAYGQEFTEHFADLYMTIDIQSDFESRLSIGKVKEATGKVRNTMWGFKIVDSGANLHGIQEMIRCTGCNGKGYTGSGQSYHRCQSCDGKKYVYKSGNI